MPWLQVYSWEVCTIAAAGWVLVSTRLHCTATTAAGFHAMFLSRAAMHSCSSCTDTCCPAVLRCSLTVSLCITLATHSRKPVLQHTPPLVPLFQTLTNSSCCIATYALQSCIHPSIQLTHLRIAVCPAGCCEEGCRCSCCSTEGARHHQVCVSGLVLGGLHGCAGSSSRARQLQSNCFPAPQHVWAGKGACGKAAVPTGLLFNPRR